MHMKAAILLAALSTAGLLVGGWSSHQSASIPLWRKVGSTNDVRESPGLVLLSDGRVLVAGGHRDPKWRLIGSAELYDPKIETWRLTGSLVEPREGIGSLTLLANGKVLLAGEHDTRIGAELYDTNTGKWTSTGPLVVGRGGHSTTLLADGKVLVAGGINYSAPGTPIFASAELYNPTTQKWSLTGSMKGKRFKHRAVRLANGKVLVVGGTATEPSDDRALASAELYDPASGTWKPTGALSLGRENPEIALLRDGRVLIAGGATGKFGHYTSVANAEVYDPKTQRWSPTGPMTQGRSQFTLTMLPDGHVLAAGGVSASALSSSEIYDPASGTWSRAGAMVMPRWNHRALLLPNGKVLVVGGYNLFGQLSGVEEFSQP